MKIKLILPDDTNMIYAVILKGKDDNGVYSGMVCFEPRDGKTYDLKEGDGE